MIFFTGTGTTAQTNVYANLPLKVQGINLDTINTLCNDLYDLFLDAGQEIATLNNFVENFQKQYSRVVSLCYSGSPVLVSDLAFRSNTSRDMRRLESDVLYRNKIAGDKLLRVAFSIVDYEEKVEKIKKDKWGRWSDLRKFVEAKAEMKLNSKKIAEEIKKYEEKVGVSC